MSPMAGNCWNLFCICHAHLKKEIWPIIFDLDQSVIFFRQPVAAINKLKFITVFIVKCTHWFSYIINKLKLKVVVFCIFDSKERVQCTYNIVKIQFFLKLLKINMYSWWKNCYNLSLLIAATHCLKKTTDRFKSKIIGQISFFKWA